MQDKEAFLKRIKEVDWEEKFNRIDNGKKMDIQAYVVFSLNVLHRHFPDSSIGRESASNARDLGSGETWV